VKEKSLERRALEKSKSGKVLRRRKREKLAYAHEKGGTGEFSHASRKSILTPVLSPGRGADWRKKDQKPRERGDWRSFIQKTEGTSRSGQGQKGSVHRR